MALSRPTPNLLSPSIFFDACSCCCPGQDHAHYPSSVSLSVHGYLIFRRFRHMQQTASKPCPWHSHGVCVCVCAGYPCRPWDRPRVAPGFLAVICMHFAIQHFKLSPMSGPKLVCVSLPVSLLLGRIPGSIRSRSQLPCAGQARLPFK